MPEELSQNIVSYRTAEDGTPHKNADGTVVRVQWISRIGGRIRSLRQGTACQLPTNDPNRTRTLYVPLSTDANPNVQTPDAGTESIC